MSAQIYIKGKVNSDKKIVASKGTGKTFSVFQVFTSRKRNESFEYNNYDVMCFDDFCDVRKGDIVSVYGEEQHIKFKDRNGVDRIKVQIIARDVVSQRSSSEMKSSTTLTAMSEDAFDDVPF